MAKTDPTVLALAANRGRNFQDNATTGHPGAKVGRRRRWMAEKCVPLVVLARVLGWLVAGLAMVPIWIYLLKGLIR